MPYIPYDTALTLPALRILILQGCANRPWTWPELTSLARCSSEGPDVFDVSFRCLTSIFPIMFWWRQMLLATFTPCRFCALHISRHRAHSASIAHSYFTGLRKSSLNLARAHISGQMFFWRADVFDVSFRCLTPIFPTLGASGFSFPL